MLEFKAIPTSRFTAIVFISCLTSLMTFGALQADEPAYKNRTRKELRKAEKQFKVKLSKEEKADQKALKRETKLAMAKPKLKLKTLPKDRSSVLNRSMYSPVQPWRPQKGERMTVDLPASYIELDTDFDGQIGLYEWIVARREKMELFDEIDTDYDGLLTPRELEEFDEAASDDDDSLAKRYQRPRLLIVGGSSATSRGSRKPFMSKEDRQKQVQTAAKILPHVDKDKDGRVSASELRESKKLNYMFDKAGIKIEDMSQQQFAERYADSIDFFAEQKAKERDKGEGGN